MVQLGQENFANAKLIASAKGGVAGDLIEAHKWFNLAASKGHEDAPHCRCEIAEEMTPREIAEAQRRARAWLLERSALNG